MWPTFRYCFFRGEVRSLERALGVFEAGDVKSRAAAVAAALSPWLCVCSGSGASRI